MYKDGVAFRGPSEADSAEAQVIAPPIASFMLDWLIIQVTAEKFIATTADMGHLAPLSELVLGTFAALRHTPVRQMGLNRNMH